MNPYYFPYKFLFIDYKKVELRAKKKRKQKQKLLVYTLHKYAFGTFIISELYSPILQINGDFYDVGSITSYSSNSISSYFGFCFNDISLVM